MARVPIIIDEKVTGSRSVTPRPQRAPRFPTAEAGFATAAATGVANRSVTAARLGVAGALGNAATAEGQGSDALAAAAERSGDQIARGGEALLGIGIRLDKARERTLVAETTTDYITQLDAATDEYRQDPDFRTAPGRMAARRREIENELLGRIDRDETRAELEQKFRVRGLSAQNVVDAAALEREASHYVASVDRLEIAQLNHAANAGSPAEQAAEAAVFRRAVQDGVDAGFYLPDYAERRLRRFGDGLDEAQLARLVRDDPAVAVALLNDPDRYATMPPLDRQRWLTQAIGAADTRAIEGLVARAALDPASVSVQLGRVLHRTHLEQIFETLVIPQESGGDPKAVSEKGAHGIAQIMPATAREVAAALGRADVAALPSAELEKLLLDDPDLNKQLGLTYLQWQLRAFDGRLHTALAAYNAGPDRARRWHARAVEEYGADYTAEDLVTVIDIAETRDYVIDIWARAGATMDGAGVSPASVHRLTQGLVSEFDRQAAARAAQLKRAAADQRAEDDIPASLAAGFPVDPDRLAEATALHQQAADAGDAASGEWLRQKDFGLRVGPIVTQAYGMPPAVLDAKLARAEATLLASDDVTEAQLAEVEVRRAVRDDVARRAPTDPIGLLVRAGTATPVPLDPDAEPTDAGFQQALVARGAQALRAASIYGVAAKPFRPTEAQALRERFASAAPSEQANMMATLAATLPPDVYTAGAGQVVGDNRLFRVGGRIAARNPTLGRTIFEGAALMSAPGVKPPSQDITDALASTVRGAVYLSPDDDIAVRDASLAIYVARRGRTEALYATPDMDELERAVEAVTGPLIRHNGKITPVWPGITEGAFTGILDDLRDEDLAPFGGAVDHLGQPFDAAWLGRHAVLLPLELGGSRYVVTLGDRPVMTEAVDANGQRDVLVIDMAAISPLGRQRAGPPDIDATVP